MNYRIKTNTLHQCRCINGTNHLALHRTFHFTRTWCLSTTTTTNIAINIDRAMSSVRFLLIPLSMREFVCVRGMFDGKFARYPKTRTCFARSHMFLWYSRYTFSFGRFCANADRFTSSLRRSEIELALQCKFFSHARARLCILECRFDVFVCTLEHTSRAQADVVSSLVVFFGGHRHRTLAQLTFCVCAHSGADFRVDIARLDDIITVRGGGHMWTYIALWDFASDFNNAVVMMMR